MTISSKEILAKSGQTFGEIKSSAGLGGPAFCWYRFEAEPNQRVELQVYRIKRLGKRHLESNRCVGGFLQLVKGTSLEYRYVFFLIGGVNSKKLFLIKCSPTDFTLKLTDLPNINLELQCVLDSGQAVKSTLLKKVFLNKNILEILALKYQNLE